MFSFGSPDVRCVLNSLLKIDGAGCGWQSVEGAGSGVSSVVSCTCSSHFGSLKNRTAVDSAGKQ